MEKKLENYRKIDKNSKNHVCRKKIKFHKTRTNAKKMRKDQAITSKLYKNGIKTTKKNVKRGQNLRF